MIRKPEFYAETPETSDKLHDPFALQPDALSDVLELIRVRGNTVFTCAASTPFGIRFPTGKHRLHVVRSGNIAIAVDGIEQTYRASQGDLVMFPHGHGHVISDQDGR